MSIKWTIPKQSFGKKHSIYRVPDWVSAINKMAYNPQLVSFGPYHHREEHLKAMEAHKERALLHFLRRSNKTLYFYFQSLSNCKSTLLESLFDFVCFTFVLPSNILCKFLFQSDEGFQRILWFVGRFSWAETPCIP